MISSPAVGTDRLGVLSSTRRVVEQSRYVRVDEAAIASLAPGLARRIQPPGWNAQHHWVEGSDRGANWLLVLDALNFSFWGEPRWQVEYRGDTLNGYHALAAALSRAMDDGVPIADASYLANLTDGELRQVLRGTNTIPMLDRRVEHLVEVGELLLREYEGSFARAIQACGHSAVRLVQLLADKLVSFNDIAEHGGREVRFYKRAQILAADLYGAFKGEGLGRFDDIEQLTAFADYKLPQVLHHLGLLTYLPSLIQKIDNRFLLPAGSQEEVELRACTIWAVELLRQALGRHGSTLRAFELDWWLWNEGQRFGASDRPYHVTRSAFY